MEKYNWWTLSLLGKLLRLVQVERELHWRGRGGRARERATASARIQPSYARYAMSSTQRQLGGHCFEVDGNAVVDWR
jgi:hypothetical protein